MLKARVRQAQQLAGLGSIGPTLAHEVNNLLTPIIGYAGSALSSGDVELMTKALRVTVQNAKIVVNMADRLLKLSAAKTATRTAVNVREAVDNAYAGLCRDVTRDGITFTVDVPDRMTVWADALQVQQVLFNLLLNAREAMKGAHNGRLSIRAFAQEKNASATEQTNTPGLVVIEVCNSGRAIPADRLPHIFDAFESSKTSKDGEAKCSGLGLSLCRDLVEENGGSISVTSDATQGTMFTLRLPIRP